MVKQIIIRCGAAAAVCGMLAAMPATAHAAETSGEYTPDSLSVNLKAVDVVANRADSRTPAAYSNISAAQIREINDGRDIPSLLEMMPSVIMTGDAGGGIGYSSLSVRGSDASRINVTANGIPINDSESSRVYWVNMPDLASSLRDIQVQRGAGTSTNGAGAFGASINMVTDAPSQEAGAEFSAAYGSYNANRESLKVHSGLINGHWSVDARLSHIGSDGYIDRAWSKLWSYMGQIAYQNSGTQVRLLGFGGKERTYMAWDYASKEDMEKYGRRYNPCGEYIDDQGNRAYYPDQYDNFVQHHLQLLIYQRLAERWHLNVAGHYTRGDGYYNQLKTNRKLVEYGLTPFTSPDGELVKRSDLVRKKFNANDFGGFTASLRYGSGRVNATLGGAANWFVGRHYGQVAWVRNYIGAINPLQEYYRNNGHKFDSNIFARTDISLWRGLSAFADVQYRHIHYSIGGLTDNWDDATDALARIDLHRDWDFFNPKAGFVYNEGAHRAFASWSVAHKEPVRDNFTDGDPRIYPKAERLFDYELGYTFSHRIFSAGINLYYMDYKDQLVTTGQLSDTGNPLSVNVPSSYRMGIELQGSLRPVDWFDWQINATLSRNRIKDFKEYIYEWEDPSTTPMIIDCGDTPIAFSPDFILHNSLNFRYRGFEASVDSRYISSQYMNNARTASARLDAYFVTDLRLAYEFLNIPSVKSLRVGFAIYNIFNEKYCNNGYTGAGYEVNDRGEKEIYRYSGYSAQAPLNVMGTVALRF